MRLKGNSQARFNVLVKQFDKALESLTLRMHVTALDGYLGHRRSALDLKLEFVKVTVALIKLNLSPAARQLSSLSLLMDVKHKFKNQNDLLFVQ
jgi:hypothetical protein